MGSYPWPARFLADARETVAPRRGSKDGLLPPLLVCLTENATARKLAVPDLTTTVLTLTITGIAADSPLGAATGAHAARRLLSVAAMLAGAVAGALLVLHARIVYPLAIALVLLAAVALTALARARGPHAPPSAVP